MKKRTLLLNKWAGLLPPGCPVPPDPADYGNPDGPGDPGYDEYEAAVDKWHNDYDNWVDAGMPTGQPCGQGQWSISYTDPTTGEKRTINQDSTEDEMEDFNNWVDASIAANQ